MGAQEKPTIRKVIVGKHLRRLRNAAGMPIEPVAESFGVSRAAAYRQESGSTTVSVADMEKYISLYRVHDQAVIERLRDLVSTSREKGWWEGYRDVADLAQVEIADLEDLAQAISNYEPMVIPGLIQTDRYSEAIIVDSSAPLRPTGTDPAKTLELRNQRKGILAKENRPDLSFVFSEIAIRFPAAGSEVMAQQIQHIKNLIDNEEIDIRILACKGEHPYRMPTRQILTISTEGESGESIAYFESPLGGTLIDDPTITRHAAELFAYTRGQALSARETSRYLEEVLDQQTA